MINGHNRSAVMTVIIIQIISNEYTIARYVSLFHIKVSQTQ